MNKPFYKRITFYRYISLTFFFFLIVINPILIYKYGITFIQGWYQSFAVGNFFIVSPLEGIESILTSKSIYLTAIIGMLFPIILASLLGRVFCSWVCPISFLSELTDKIIGIFSKKLKYQRNFITLPKYILWFALIAEIIFTLIIGYPLFVWWSPPALVGREIMLYVFYKIITIEIGIVLIILLLNLLTKRFFCRYLCPLGALLALFGKNRKLVIEYDSTKCINCKLCDQRCPLDIKPSIGNSEGIHCWNCFECKDACPTEALKITWGKDKVLEFKINKNISKNYN
ncbi:MAG TPA: 4Fe-4S binding protein [Desulfurobacteriaceae bacterium]|nr:4Fe-4S binding protein [Desulfurobacteriaceae bacterium]